MSHEFHIGQKVVCVDDSTIRKTWPLRKGMVYTVANAYMAYTYYRGHLTKKIGPKIELVEVNNPSPQLEYFCANRFRPVQTKKTDISIFTDLLKPTKAKQPETS